MWTLNGFVLMMLLVLANSQLDYTVHFNSPLYVCPDEVSQAFVDTSEVQLKWYNATTNMMVGAINYLKGFEQDTTIELVLAKDLGGSYEIMLSHEVCDACAELANPYSAYGFYMRRLGFPRDCPFEANKYPIRNLEAYPRNLPIDSDMAGSYQLTINIKKRADEDCLPDGMTFIACVTVDLIVEHL
ncbi:uncharacterized protein LOC123877508 [Maniola jurtina]|uniref:uncharacterized protein LOC123877508 n=1 Tax=Maniola jurtina TaxID=191418 RepID=UPI001E68654F|nr:uncharacterized protein LOC123877508 [Maniola jurtina]